MSIQNGLNAAIYTKLTGGTALTALLAGTTSVYYQQAPDDATLPYVIFSYPSEIDQNLIPHRMKDIVLRVHGVCTVPALAGTIDAQIDSLLHETTLSIGTAYGYTNIWTRRENGYQMITTDEAGIRFYTSGADYRVELTKG